MVIWIINPYGNIPGEPWRTYRSTMLADALTKRGNTVVQLVSNFEHRSKKFRSKEYKVIQISELYMIHLIPTTGYNSNISIKRILSERTYAKNIINNSFSIIRPDCVVIAEPAVCYYDIISDWIIKDLRAKIILDVLDLWPELFHLYVPKVFDKLALFFLAPLYYRRRKLYNNANAVVACSKDYLKVANSIRRFDLDRSAVVYLCIQEEKQLKNEINNFLIKKLIEEKRKEEVWAIYAGTLGENYDIEVLMGASKKLASRYTSSKFKVLIAGAGPLVSYCEKNADGNSIIFLGHLQPHELSFVLSNADFALSTYKGRSTVAMPVKTFDYLFFGLPLVNSLGRDLGELVADKNVGINYVAESLESLESAMSTLIENSIIREEFRSNAFNLSKEFNVDVQYNKFVNIIESVVNGNT